MIKKKCKQCGKEFVLSDSEIKFFKEKDLDLPKRCSSCRKRNKKNNNNINNNIDSNIDNNTIKTVDNNIKETNIKNNNGNKKTFRKTIIAGLVLAVLLIGKFVGIVPSWVDFGTSSENGQSNISLQFRNDKLWEDHFIKHGDEFNYASKEDYLKGANEVLNSPSVKRKTEAEDGDEIYYDADKNEIVFVSSDGYIRTYFKPSDGMEYFNRQ